MKIVKTYINKITAFELALMVGFIHLLFLIIIQFENFFLYVASLSNNQANILAYLGGLGFDNIVFSIFLGVLAFILCGNFLLKAIYFGFIILVNLYLVIDQLAYKIFFDHLRLGLSEGTAGLDVLLSSIIAEVDIAFYINAAFWLLTSFLLFMVIFFHKSVRNKRILPSVIVMSISLVFLFVSVESSGDIASQHPVLALLANSSESFVPVVPVVPVVPIIVEQTSAGNESDFYQSQFDTIEDSPDVKKELALVTSRVKAKHNKPNIILIVLESVGSQQLLTNNGLPDETLTPTLHTLAKNAVLFNSVYSVYPATVLSHVSMNTGGPAITLGNIYKDLSYTYQGPTLNKALSALGYQTAIFSSQKLNYGNLGGFYKNLAYDKYFDFGETSEAFQKQHALHSWGGEEMAVMDEAISWIDGLKDLQQPFFLNYLTNATHHPYSVPDSFEAVVDAVDDPDSKFTEYQNSLAYTDKVIQHLVQYLKQNNLIENTIIAITGDHGEAFGKKHEKNITHRNYLYEENVKIFLLLSNSSLMDKTVISRQVATIGDIMPTLLFFAKAPQIFLPAQNLLGKTVEPRIAYFHKNSPPNLWGLRDGRWKYIDTRLGSNPQLFDLNADSVEANNLAVLHPDKIAKYRELAAKWYISSNNLFLSRLASYRPVGGVLPNEAQLQQPGPKGITMGYQNGNGFVEASNILNTQQVSAWVSWVSYLQEKTLVYAWQSPSGIIHRKAEVSFPGWADTLVKIPVALPLEVGEWRLSIYDGNKLLLSEKFNLNSKI